MTRKMKIFVIHKSKDRADANCMASNLRRELRLPIKFTFVSSSIHYNWKNEAENKIKECEVVLNFFAEDSEKSPNILWELEQANKYHKPIIKIGKSDSKIYLKKEISRHYHFEDEFEECFPESAGETENIIQLYKLMVETSEQLVQRRQLVNGFYLTLIVGLLAAMGFVLDNKLVEKEQMLWMVIPSFIGLFVSLSWKRIIESFGELNKGKFEVINKLETLLPVKMFTAEWIALGNGKRPQKYMSFTKTEKKVPLTFAWFFLALEYFFIYPSIIDSLI